MLMSFDVMQRKNRAITRRQLRDGLVERNPIDDRHGVRILGAFDDLHGHLAFFRGLLEPHATLAKVHQHLINGQPMQPGREGRFAAEATHFAKELDENFLRQILGFNHVPRHAQTERVNAAIVPLIELLEGLHVALGGLFRQLVIRSSRCLGFAYSHWFLSLWTMKPRRNGTQFPICPELFVPEGRVLVSDHSLRLTSGGVSS